MSVIWCLNQGWNIAPCGHPSALQPRGHVCCDAHPPLKGAVMAGGLPLYTLTEVGGGAERGSRDLPCFTSCPDDQHGCRKNQSMTLILEKLL